MRQIRPFADSRLDPGCVHCGAQPNTRDHVPPRALLDPPYPDNLAIVPSCHDCNTVASADEQYLACVLEVAACGSIDPAELERESIARTLVARPALRAMIGADFTSEGTLQINVDRVHRVIEKTARGLWTYETSVPWVDETASVGFLPLGSLDEPRRRAFLTVAGGDLLPEVGSRLMFRIIEDWHLANRWQVVQADRFAYAIETGRGGDRVKMLLRGYLAAEVVFIPTS